MCSCLSSLSRVLSLVRGLTVSDCVTSFLGNKLTLWPASGSQSVPSLRQRLGEFNFLGSLFQQSDSQREGDTSIFRLFLLLPAWLQALCELIYVFTVFFLFSQLTCKFSPSVSLMYRICCPVGHIWGIHTCFWMAMVAKQRTPCSFQILKQNL